MTRIDVLETKVKALEVELAEVKAGSREAFNTTSDVLKELKLRQTEFEQLVGSTFLEITEILAQLTTVLEVHIPALGV